MKKEIVLKQINLSNYTTIKVGGVAEYFAEPSKVSEFLNLIKWSHLNNQKCRIIGAGSNILVNNIFLEGLFICTKKINIYNQMASVLVGHSETGAILEFDEDGNIAAGGTKSKEVFFINFSRLLTKDEIKKGSFTLSLMTGGVPAEASPNPLTDVLNLSDHGAATSYFVNSPAGEYAILYPSAADATAGTSKPTQLCYPGIWGF